MSGNRSSSTPPVWTKFAIAGFGGFSGWMFVHPFDVLKVRLQINEGANVITGGEQVLQETGGCYVNPTVFKDVKNSMKVAKEEIFGPVLCTIDFENEDEALEIANDTNYGLNAMIWSNDLNKVHKLAKRIKSGKVLINSVSDGDMSLPHGGYKQSGFGRDKSLEALGQYTQTKLTLIEIK